MTTEIAIINRLGVALATDSAVTISGGGRTKVWDTADKLFELSSMYPVGIMINGNMDCLGIPWEILIREFRSSEGNFEKGSVETWMRDFLSFVERHEALGAPAAERYVRQLIETKIKDIQRAVSQRINDIVNSSQSLPRRRWPNIRISELLLAEIDEEIALIKETPMAESLQSIDHETLLTRYNLIFEDLIREKFPKIPAHAISSEEEAGLKYLFARYLVSVCPSEYATGLVFAGYGFDIFPAVHSVEVDGMVLDKLKFNYIERETFDGSNGQGRVVSFAQTDVIERLLGGADPRFVAKTSEFIHSAVSKIGKIVEESMRRGKVKPAEVKRRQSLIREISELVAEEYQSDVAVELRKKFEREFDRMIALMPKQELIELAEALVSITAVERKASADEGTVGGPIDVALITKHEGFVWIKRKHYFDKDLNPRYFWRMSRQSR